MEKSARPRTALNECVKVVVRCRPLSEKEKNEGYDEVRKIRPEQKWYERLSTKPTPDNKIFKSPLQVVKVWAERGAVQVYNPKGQDKLFTYDAAYDCTADTQTIYDEMVRPLVASVLDGFNGCVFAYGQTGTGKTHTMEGTAEHEGIIPRAFRHIWAHIENNASPDITHLVSCSYVELYLEDVRDLLAKDCKKLTIRGQEILKLVESLQHFQPVAVIMTFKDISALKSAADNFAIISDERNDACGANESELNGFYIPEMTSVVCKSAAEMVRVMRAGNRNRAAGRTDMNEHSSRSHAVFLVTVETAHRTTNRIRVGKLNLVDLAGSERQRKTGAGGERLREAARINQALSSLGNVISALAENSPHVPYRDSKLTRILQDSLGGNSKTIMIANIGPASYNYDETITTLRYAHRAKAIKNKPVRNEDPKDAKLREYQAEIERLRALIERRHAAERRKRPPRARAKHEPEEETASLESEHILAESTIEQEKTKTEEIENQIKALEERLVQGGGGKDLINNLNETQMILEQRNLEIAERKKREVEMQQKIDLEEETTAIVTNTFATLQQEVDHKTQRLKKCLSKYACLREEMVEQREAHDAERREHEALQAALIAELRRRLLVADSFVPEAGRSTVLRLRYNDDADAWELPEHAGAEPLAERPTAAGARRPTCAPALAGEPRRRADNLLDLRPLPLPPTARRYVPPAPAPAPAPPAALKARPPATEVVSKKEPVTEKRRLSGAVRPRAPSALQRLGTAGVR
ncbi:kinesin-II 95 kDa subunit-like [Melitaea cinxia]|uniref:kinesin-II 95 kDa subunit-like n=1 Tax=Melitaea cinxia TaxID=113334 RepID=UPI001E271700|nr:kinesin-II 95 kDa subunit-like [Melitaea cinxia]